MEPEKKIIINELLKNEADIESEYKSLLQNSELRLIDKIKPINKLIKTLHRNNKAIKPFIVFYLPTKTTIKEKNYKVHIRPIEKDFRKYSSKDFKPILRDWTHVYNVTKNYFKNLIEFCDLLYWNSEWVLTKKEAEERVKPAQLKLKEYFSNEQMKLTKYDIMLLVNFDENFDINCLVHIFA